jgi:hypothetical protein
MKNKQLLTALTILACTSVQSSTQYPDLTHNYDSVWQADIDDLGISNIGITKKQLRGVWPHYLSPSRALIDLGNIKTPAHTRFVNAGHYFSDQLIYGKDSKSIYGLDVYIAKDQLTRIISQNFMVCEYKINLDSYYGNKHFDNLDKIKNDYLDYASDTGANARSFIDQEYLQGYVSDKDGYNDGLMHVLIKGRVLSLLASDCTKMVSKDQIIKDLTEWSELLIEANQ